MSIGYFQWTKIGCFRWTRSGCFRRTLTKIKGNTAEHAKEKALREDSIRQGIVGHSISDAGALI